jgi:hypothetical protein
VEYTLKVARTLAVVLFTEEWKGIGRQAVDAVTDILLFVQGITAVLSVCQSVTVT